MPWILPDHITPETQIQLGDWSNSMINNKTLAQVVSDVANLGYNSFMLTIGTATIQGQTYIGYYRIACFNVNQTDYHLATQTYLNLQYPSNGVEKSWSGSQPVGYAYNYGYLNQPASINLTTIAVDGITYYTNQNTYGTTIAPLVYIGGNVTNMYIDGALPVLYTWSSVPAISGKNGILSLTMIKDEKIEEGNTQHIVLPDDNIARFTDQSNIRKLCLNQNRPK